MASRVIRRILKFINMFLMVPLFRLGLGSFVGNPITGYIMVVKTIGRKTGKGRYVPVNYAILDGNIYCMAGFGKGTHWYRNLQAQPNIEIIIPSGPLAGVAEDATNSEEAIRLIRQLLKNSGFAGFFAGFNPFTVSDTELREKTKDYPLIRIRPTGVGSGAGDAGGWLWILSLVVSVVVLWFVLR
ncbi:MAG: nitroreductase family deazaflavin-dependent oxidoreductase [Chloroflexi bacterium]|nr:nitroreductase family deazaflavin-dependent oxidoreductase [Chloroflexota bacterium]